MDNTEKYREFYNLCLNKKLIEVFDFINNFELNNINSQKIYSKLYNICVSAQYIEGLELFKDKNISAKEYKRSICSAIKKGNYYLLNELLEEKRYEVNKNLYINKLILSNNFDLYKTHYNMNRDFDNINSIINNLIKIDNVDIYNDIKNNFIKNKINDNMDYIRLIIIKNDKIEFNDYLKSIKNQKIIPYIFSLIVSLDKPLLANELRKYMDNNSYDLGSFLEKINMIFTLDYKKNKSLDILLSIMDYSNYLNKYNYNLNKVLKSKQETFLNFKTKERIECEIDFNKIKQAQRRKI